MNNLIEKINRGVLPDIDLLTPDQKKWFKKIYELSFDEIEQEFTEEYIFHSPKNVQVKLHGLTLDEEINYSQEDYELALQVMALKNNITWNIETPFVSFDYKNYRATLIHKEILKESGHKLFLRCLNKSHLPLSSFSLSQDRGNYFIENKKNILIAGSQGSGKTTFINSLVQNICESEHLIIAEDTFELISPHINTTRMLSQELPQYSLESFMGYAMRMRPDRIILGELRSKEVIPYLLAINSGHKGVLSTIHANTAKDAIHRVVLLYKLFSDKDIPYKTILKLVSENIDHVVFIRDKKVDQIINVLGSHEEDIFYEEFVPPQGEEVQNLAV